VVCDCVPVMFYIRGSRVFCGGGSPRSDSAGQRLRAGIGRVEISCNVLPERGPGWFAHPVTASVTPLQIRSQRD